MMTNATQKNYGTTMDRVIWHWTVNEKVILTYSNNQNILNKIGFNAKDPNETYYCDLHSVIRPGSDRSVLRITAINPITGRTCVIYTSPIEKVRDLAFLTAHSTYQFASCGIR